MRDPVYAAAELTLGSCCRPPREDQQISSAHLVALVKLRKLLVPLEYAEASRGAGAGSSSRLHIGFPAARRVLRMASMAGLFSLLSASQLCSVICWLL